MSAEEFFSEILLKNIGALHIVCGFNFRFGANGSGDTELLNTLCEKHGVGLSVIDPVALDGMSVSSSAIRRAISDGDTKLAARLLGRPYSLRERVVNGQHLARKLGFSTANQVFPEKKAVLRYGVYSVRVRVGRKAHLGIANVGMRPTVNGSLLCAETHIFDFDGDLYGKYITVEFLEFIRPERKFDSINELEKQIKQDIEHVRCLS
jgi:riboflavin kinase/FMN adenylyltransferase